MHISDYGPTSRHIFAAEVTPYIIIIIMEIRKKPGFSDSHVHSLKSQQKVGTLQTFLQYISFICLFLRDHVPQTLGKYVQDLS